MYRTDAPAIWPNFRMLPALVMLAAGMLLPDAAVGQSADDAKSLRACDGYMVLYARSASRKLARALSGQGYRLEALDLPETIEADRNGQPTTYATLFEKDRRAAGLVDTTRDARRSFVVVGTEQGPVMTSHLWPSRAEIANGTRCRPTSSRIEFPRVAVRSVDVEPFKYWGLRISWHLPESFDAQSAHSDRDFVREVIGTADGSGAEDRATPDEPSATSSSPPDEASEGAQTQADRQKADTAPDVDEDERTSQ